MFSLYETVRMKVQDVSHYSVQTILRLLARDGLHLARKERYEVHDLQTAKSGTSLDLQFVFVQ